MYRQNSAAELLQGYLRAIAWHRLILPIGLPGKAARAVRTGAILAPERAVDRRAWEECLAERIKKVLSRSKFRPVCIPVKHLCPYLKVLILTNTEFAV